MKMKMKLISSELLFVLYYFGFALLKRVIHQHENYSTIILFIYSIIIIILSFIIPKRNNKNCKWILLIGIIFIMFLFDLLFRNNNLIFKYIYNFIIYGVIPMYLLSKVNDSRKLLNIYSIMSVLIYFIYALDPINGYIYFGDYMEFGFQVALPTYIGLYIGRKYFKYKWMLLPEILCLLEVITFSNRSTILSIVFIWIITILFFDENGWKKNIKLFIYLIFSFILTILFLKELPNIILVLQEKGYRAYSLYQIQQYITTKDIVQFSSGRDLIWNFAKALISKNMLFGSGTASFEATHNYYVHNIIFDLLLQYGVLGLILFMILLIKSTIRIFNYKSFNKLLGIIFLCTWCPKLFFSLIMFKDMGLWCFFVIGLGSLGSDKSKLVININDNKIVCIDKRENGI